MDDILNQISSIVWGPVLLTLLVGTGLFLTIRLRLWQFRMLGPALKLAFTKSDKDKEGDISHFSSLMIALAATIGTGNIVGVATAITLGGPGALFWMWITAIVGMATKYGEAVLAVKYRTKNARGEMAGGPMYYLEQGLNSRALGVMFAFFGAIAAFGIGNMVQAHSVAEAMKVEWGIPIVYTGGVLTALTALVVIGGVKTISSVTRIVVPFMALFYVAGGLVILALHAALIPQALYLIIKSAVTPVAATGGFAGATIQMALQRGVSRGVFSNESGLGSAAIVAAAAKTDVPARQGLVAMTGTFIDTICVCTITGLAIIVTGSWLGVEGGVSLTHTAFRTGLPGDSGGIIVSVGLIFFAYSTVLGWAYYGEKCAEYLCGVRVVRFYRYLWVIFVFVGSTMTLGTVWSVADIFNGLMAFPNLIGLLFLSGVISKESRLFIDNSHSKGE